jgi:hypothetical protein
MYAQVSGLLVWSSGTSSTGIWSWRGIAHCRQRSTSILRQYSRNAGHWNANANALFCFALLCLTLLPPCQPKHCICYRKTLSVLAQVTPTPTPTSSCTQAVVSSACISKSPYLLAAAVLASAAPGKNNHRRSCPSCLPSFLSFHVSAQPPSQLRHHVPLTVVHKQPTTSRGSELQVST